MDASDAHGRKPFPGRRERRRRSEDEADEGRRAGDASAVDNGNKAAVPVGGSGSSM